MSQRSWVRFPFKPEFFSGLLFPQLLKLSTYCDDLHLLKIYFLQYKYMSFISLFISKRIRLGIWTLSKNTDSFIIFSHCSARMAETSDYEEELFLTQSSFSASLNRGNELQKCVSLNNRQVDYENAQFNVEEATEGLFSFDHSDEHQEVSIGSVSVMCKCNSVSKGNVFNLSNCCVVFQCNKKSFRL